jgi:ubiquinone/menaquinone biosynthesis C-methylase UbiE
MIAKGRDFLKTYARLTPLALAFERSLECTILARMTFEKPILDVGCGDGIFASVLFDEQIDTGIDPNAVELEHAAKLGCYSKLIQCRGGAIPEPDGQYRTIFSNSVLEHIPDMTSVLTEAYRLLSPGGMLYLTVPTDRFERASVISRLLSTFWLHETDQKFRQFYNRFWNHYHCYTPERWSEIIGASGFRIETIRPYDPPNVCTLNDLLVPFGLFGFMLKRKINKWTFFPSLRQTFFAPVAPIARWLLRGADRAENGGLVFIAASKP